MKRIYSYKGDDGVSYWSFTKKPITTTPPIRLTLQSKIGEHLVIFLTRLKRLGGAAGKNDG